MLLETHSFEIFILLSQIVNTSFYLATIALWPHLTPFRTQKWNAVAPMVVWEFPCESRTLLGFYSYLGTNIKPVTMLRAFLQFKIQQWDASIALWPHLTPFTINATALQRWNAVVTDGNSVWVFVSLCESRTLLGFYSYLGTNKKPVTMLRAFCYFEFEQGRRALVSAIKIPPTSSRCY